MDASKTIRLHPKGQIPRPPTFAAPARQAVHLLMSAAGWVVFFYWWGIVLRQVTRQTVELTGLFLLVSLVVVVAVTMVWSLHNKRLHDRKGPRTQVREVEEDYTRDIIGRAVTFEGSRARIQAEAEVEVAFDEGSKTYRATRASLANDHPERRSGESP